LKIIQINYFLICSNKSRLIRWHLLYSPIDVPLDNFVCGNENVVADYLMHGKETTNFVENW
jgi:hypothetical protein